MTKKFFMVLFMMLLMATASVSYAATVSLDNVSKNQGESITIPVNITGYDSFIAGEFVLDFNTEVNLTGLSVEAGEGTLYANGLADFSAADSMDDITQIGEWYKGTSPKDAAVDYETDGAKLYVYLYAPEGTAGADGVLFNIKGTVPADAIVGADTIELTGKIFNEQNKTEGLSVSDTAILTIGDGDVVDDGEA